MSVCRELGKTVKEGMEMTVFELKLWAAFFKLENDRNKEQMDKMKARRGRR
jgi:hypothetical protein